MSLVCLYVSRHSVIAVPKMLFDFCHCAEQLCGIDSMSGIIWLINSATVQSHSADSDAFIVGERVKHIYLHSDLIVKV